MRRWRGSGSPGEPIASTTTGSARMLTASKRMQAGVDVGGDQKHEAPIDDEPDALKVEVVEKREPEGDGEARKQASDAKGRRRRRRLVIYTPLTPSVP